MTLWQPGLAIVAGVAIASSGGLFFMLDLIDAAYGAVALDLAEFAWVDETRAEPVAVPA